MRKYSFNTIFFVFMGSFLFLFILLPIVNLILSADLSSILSNLHDREVISALFISIYSALIATALNLLFGVPLAYILARHDFRGKSFVEAVVDVPIVIPHTVSGIALLLIFSSSGIIGEPLGRLGLSFTDSMPGIVIAMMFVSSSFVVNSAREGFESVDPRMEKVSRLLGAGSLRTFFVISLPLALRNIVVGGVMCWARAVSEFGAIIIIAYYPISASTLIYKRFIDFGLVDAVPVAVILISLCLSLFLVVRLCMRGWKTYDKN